MKRILLSAGALLLTMWVQAQQKQGKVVYEHTTQMSINIPANIGAALPDLPKSLTNNYELTFGNNQSLWKQAEKENDDEDDGNSTGGMVFRSMSAAGDNVTYTDFTNSATSSLIVFLDKKFIIDDSIRSLKWKISEETKKILNHVCRKATTERIGSKNSVTVTNGKMEHKEMPDTSIITAWFTGDIPVPAGPAGYEGQLPGLILALDVNNGRQVYKAVEITEKADLAVIKKPAGKKHITYAEFKKETTKMINEMQGSGRGLNIKMN